MDKIYQWSGDRECWLEAPPGYGPCEPPQGDMVLVERHDPSDVCQETILDYRQQEEEPAMPDPWLCVDPNLLFGV